jgi:hypothetical protein
MKLRVISCLTVLLILSVSGGNAKAAPACWFVNGNCYDRIEVEGPGINWEDAKTAAESRLFQGVNGHLATVTSQEENDFIVNNLGGPDAVRSHWLGGFQLPGSQEPDGGWQWVTGEPFVFTNWAPAEPNNAGGNEDAIGFHGPPLSGLWNDGSKNVEDLGYIVEYPVASISAQELLERIETLEGQMEDLTEHVMDLQEDLENHRHIYRTGKGKGHNNRKAKTGPAKFPATH